MNRSSHGHGGRSYLLERWMYVQRLALQPDIYQELVQSLAPSIREWSKVKKWVCMLFGENSKGVQVGTHHKNHVTR